MMAGDADVETSTVMLTGAFERWLAGGWLRSSSRF